MLSAMAEIVSQGSLRVARALGVDACGGPAQRAPSLGADSEPRSDGRAALERNRNPFMVKNDLIGIVLDKRKGGQRAGAQIEDRQQIAVFNIMAEGIEPDLARSKSN